jgi:hypothetical protein
MSTNNYITTANSPNSAQKYGEGFPIWYEAALLAGDIARCLNQTGMGQEYTVEPPWLNTLSFFTSQSQLAINTLITPTPQPLDKFSRLLGLPSEERKLIVLAGMAEEHEGYSAGFAAIHPRQEPRPTVGLFARLIFADISRKACLQLLESTLLIRLGVVQIAGDGPIPEKNITLCPKLWQVLHRIDTWPDEISPLAIPDCAKFYDDWLASNRVQRAITVLEGNQPSIVILEGEASYIRVQQLIQQVNHGSYCFEPQVLGNVLLVQAALSHCLTRNAIPVFLSDETVIPSSKLLRSLEIYPYPLLIAGNNNSNLRVVNKPLVALDAPGLSRRIQRELWSKASPLLATYAGSLSVSFPTSPNVVAKTQRDIEKIQELGIADIQFEDFLSALHYRIGTAASLYSRTIRPEAGWEDLVLPPEKMQLLSDAVARIQHQYKVLDEWGFEQGKFGRRGLRLLFSGLPGTGKTLAAEVMAKALHCDLIAVDLARVVSKWIGETEKNLATVFEQAEATRAILFFDEADALFGKRTEVSDAHDRYANIETSFLLARLERYDGVAILATNLRQNLDKAFVRRFEFIVDFPEPDVEERLLIWNKHIPQQAPVDESVNFRELAGRYPMSGAMIRNAALSSAFYAAEKGDQITYHHFERAVQLEYAKAGRTCPKY